MRMIPYSYYGVPGTREVQEVWVCSQDNETCEWRVFSGAMMPAVKRMPVRSPTTARGQGRGRPHPGDVRLESTYPEEIIRNR